MVSHVRLVVEHVPSGLQGPPKVPGSSQAVSSSRDRSRWCGFIGRPSLWRLSALRNQAAPSLGLMPEQLRDLPIPKPTALSDAFGALISAVALSINLPCRDVLFPGYRAGWALFDSGSIPLALDWGAALGWFAHRLPLRAVAGFFTTTAPDPSHRTMHIRRSVPPQG